MVTMIGLVGRVMMVSVFKRMMVMTISSGEMVIVV